MSEEELSTPIDTKVLKFKNGTYDGAVFGNKMHGIGKYTYNNGDVYTGEFFEGKFHGDGVFVSKNGDKYSGQYHYGKKHGVGTYTYSAGPSYMGHWRLGKMTGIGTYTYKSGHRHVGIFRNGKSFGLMLYVMKNGLNREEIYNLEGKKIWQGPKRRIKIDENEFVKNHLPKQPPTALDEEELKDEAELWGQINEANGVYYGQKLHGNVPHGQGIVFYKLEVEHIHTKTPALAYVGDFEHGQAQGFGRFFYKGGYKYVGHTHGGKREGKGSYCFANGDQYDGEFKNGHFHGFGMHTFANGDWKEQKWNDNELIEDGPTYSPAKDAEVIMV